MAQTTTKTSSKTSSRKPLSKSVLPKTTLSKPSLPKTRSKSASATVAPDPVIVEERTPVSDAVVLKKPELIDMIVERSGVKKRDVKPALEAALQILGECLIEGREMNLQPLGKVKLNRMKELSNARVINCKIRQPIKPQEEHKDPLAEADD